MVRLFIIFFLFISLKAYSQFTDKDAPYYWRVRNVYRRDKGAIDQYAENFIKENRALFLCQVTHTGGEHLIKTSSGFIPFFKTDSGIIANAIFIHSDDTLKETIGFLSKDFRTKIIILSVDNYDGSKKTNWFILDRFCKISEAYHNFLKEENKDKDNW